MIIKTLRYSSVFTKPYLNKYSIIISPKFRFCSGLPKPSRFSQDLGLHKQFQQLKIKVAKGEKKLSSIYQFMIWVFVCMLGSIFAGALIREQFRSRLIISFDYFLLTLLPNSYQRNVRCLKDVIKHQTQYFTHRIFTDGFTLGIIHHCIQYNASTKLQEKEKQLYEQLIDEALERNLKNRKNRYNKYALYKKYFQQIYFKTDYKQTKSMDAIISKLLKNGDLQTIYLIVLLKTKNILRLSAAQRNKCKQSVTKLEEENIAYDSKIKDVKKSNESLLLQPYEFDFTMKKKWLIFISNNV